MAKSSSSSNRQKEFNSELIDHTNCIYVIDASAFVFRAYYALAPLSSKGRPSHAVAGFASMLLKLLRDRRPKACIVVFDSKTPTFRKEIYPEYKANREIPPPDLSGQIQAVIEMCKVAELPILQQDGYEADDWIASFTKAFEKKNEIVIVSSDKDLAQLVSDNVKLYDSFKSKISGPEEIEEKWGVGPSQMRDLQALMGDSSDNVPGLSGVGPKTAAKLLTEYKSIPGILKNLSKLAPKLQEKFKEADEILKLSSELVSLKEDLEIPFKKVAPLPKKFPPAFKSFLQDWDLTRSIQQFSDLLEGSGAAEATAEASASVAQQDFILKLVGTSGELKELQTKLLKAKSFAFDCETNSFNRDEARVVGVSFCLDSSEAYYVPLRHGSTELNENEVVEFLKEVLEKSSACKIAHNAKYDLQVLEAEGICVGGDLEDTMLMAHVLQADRRSVSLENLALELLHEPKGDLKKLLDGSQDFSTVDLKEAVDYAAKDALLTFRLYELFYPQIAADKNFSWIYRSLEVPLIRVLARMELSGILLDVKKLQKLSTEMHTVLKEIEKKIYKSAGREFNIGSPKQLQVVLFEELGLTPTKKTKTGYSTNEAVLSELASEHEIPKLILEQRKLSKLTSTYVDKLPELISKSDSRLHTHYHQAGTATGRLSSSEPNLQNIPIRTEEGMKIRSAFVAEKGFQLLSADYSQVELRLMAEMSKDKKMINAFVENRDIHSETAKVIFGTDDKAHRSRAKAINFGVIYGISAFGLSQQLGIERKDAKLFIDSYFEQFPRVKEFMDECIESAKSKLYSETLFGRRRPLPDIESKNAVLRQMAERVAINAPLQGTAADIMKWAMLNVQSELSKRELKSRLLLQVHDELVVEVLETEREEVEEIVKQGMLDLSDTPGSSMTVPLVVDLSFGPNWSEL